MSYHSQYNTEPFYKSKIFIFIFVPIILFGAYSTYELFYKINNPSDETTKFRELMEKVRPILYSENVTCEQLTELRIENAVAKNWYEKPFWAFGDRDQAKIIWNILGCGNHWGFWE